MPLQIRPWTEADEPACRAAFLEAFQPLIDECPDDYKSAARSIVQEVAGGHFTDMPGSFSGKTSPSAWVAESDGKMVGYVDAWMTDPQTALVYIMFVAPGSRRGGIASQLMDTAEAYARSHNASAITHDSPHALTEAHQLYFSRGYSVTSTRPTESRREVVNIHFRKEL